jgi:hypothetical protein
MASKSCIWYVSRSTDDGITWNESFSGNTIQKFVEATNGNLIGVDSSRLLRSTDGGQNWEVVYEINSASNIGELFIGNNGNIWANYGLDSVLRSQNNGQTWSKRYIPVTGKSIHVANSGTIIISSVVGFYRSTDNGLTYQIFEIDTSANSTAGKDQTTGHLSRRTPGFNQKSHFDKIEVANFFKAQRPKRITLLLRWALILAATMEFGIHFIVCPNFVRIVPYRSNCLMHLTGFYLGFIKLNREHFGIHIPVCRSNAFNFGRFFDAFFAHSAIAVDFELSGHA